MNRSSSGLSTGFRCYEPNAERVTRFAKVLEEVTRDGPLPFRERDNLPFGKGWNNLRDAPTFSRRAGALPDVKEGGFATTLELPYANAGGHAVTPHSARKFGGQLARAMHRWLGGS